MSAAKSNEADSNKRIAGRLSHLRAVRFETKGFRSNEKTPTIAAAAKMAGDNARAKGGLRPTPSVSA